MTYIPDLSDSDDDDEEMHTEDRMVEAGMVAGADPDLANMHVKALLQGESHKPTTFMEIYGGVAICKRRPVHGGV